MIGSFECRLDFSGPLLIDYWCLIRKVPKHEHPAASAEWLASSISKPFVCRCLLFFLIHLFLSTFINSHCIPASSPPLTPLRPSPTLALSLLPLRISFTPPLSSRRSHRDFFIPHQPHFLKRKRTCAFHQSNITVRSAFTCLLLYTARLRSHFYCFHSLSVGQCASDSKYLTD